MASVSIAGKLNKGYMTINCNAKRGQKYVAKHGPFRVIVDGSEMHGVCYVDIRRKVIRKFRVRSDGAYALNPNRTKVLIDTYKAKSVVLIPMERNA